MTKFYAIGVGVGDSENLTVKAVKTIENLDILYVPKAKTDYGSTAYNIAKKYIKKETIIKDRHFPMVYDKDKVNSKLEPIAKEIIQDVQTGRNVGFITIGDPMVYSTYIYLLEFLKGKIEIETIPGITTFLDIASVTNFPLVQGEDTFAMIPATIGIEKIREYVKREDCLVIMKVYKNFNEVVEILRQEKLENCSIVVSNSSKENQKIYNIDQIENQEKVSYFTTILINKRWKND